MVTRVGISGWRYVGWRGDFYPAGLVQRRELSYAADRLSSIEINGSFYSLQRSSSYAQWRDETPEGFVFAVKGGRYVGAGGARRGVRPGRHRRPLAAGPRSTGTPARWEASGTEVFVYFDNDAKGHAPYDAMRLIERLGG